MFYLWTGASSWLLRHLVLAAWTWRSIISPGNQHDGSLPSPFTFQKTPQSQLLQKGAVPNPTKGKGKTTFHLLVACAVVVVVVVLFCLKKKPHEFRRWGCGASSLFPAASNSILWVCPEEGCCKQWNLRYVAVAKGNNICYEIHL